MGLFLLGLVLGDSEAGFELYNVGDTAHLKVCNESRKVVAHVVGNNTGDIAEQLALAVFHDVTVDQLRAVHRWELNKPMRLQKDKESK